MEELINELDIFVNEKAVLSAQIRDIESKRNELAKERNTKKAQNKINNDEDVWAEVNCLGKQISDLGNQSQWFQNQINSKLLRVREQAFIEIDNLIAESVRKSRIISTTNRKCKRKKNGLLFFCIKRGKIRLAKVWGKL